jgi:hypothetical protein
VAKARNISAVAGVDGVFLRGVGAGGAFFVVDPFVGAVFGGAASGVTVFFNAAFLVDGAGGATEATVCLTADDFLPNGCLLSVVVGGGGVDVAGGPTGTPVAARAVRFAFVATLPPFAGVLNIVPGTAVGALACLVTVLAFAMFKSTCDVDHGEIVLCV